MTDSFARDPSLVDRVVLITGGGSGIGADLVRAFVDQEAKVAFVDVQEEPSLALVDDLSSSRHVADFTSSDLTDTAALKRWIDGVRQRLGPVGILVNNAANDRRQPLAQVTEDDWDRSQAVNIRHQFFAIQSVVPDMRQLGKGAIINFSSIAWMGGGQDMPAYSAAKAAVIGLTNALARDLGPDGIRVNAIAPGAVLTEKQRRMWFDADKIKYVIARQCIKRELEGKAVARMALFLASDDADMITKQVFVVDASLR